jgi:hypothetical protein
MHNFDHQAPTFGVDRPAGLQREPLHYARDRTGGWTNFADLRLIVADDAATDGRGQICWRPVE